MNEYVERKCGRCTGGRIPFGAPDEVETEECPDCLGTCKVLCFLYPKPKGRRGAWPPEETAEGRSNGATRKTK